MTVSDNDELEELSNRLTVDLRTHIRYLNDYPLLSDEWNKMAKGLGRIGNICEMVRSWTIQTTRAANSFIHATGSQDAEKE